MAILGGSWALFFANRSALANGSPGEIGALLEVLSFIPIPVWIILGVLVAALMAGAFLFSRK